MTQLVSYREKVDSVRKLLERAKPQITMALPKHMNPDRLSRIALTSILRTPKLLECTPESLIGAVIQSAQLGLEPDDLRGHGYLVPFYNNRKGKSEVQFLPGYKGLMHLARNSGQISTIEARTVYAKDEFKYHYGLKPMLHHVPSGQKDDAAITHFYAISRLRDGGIQFEVMTKEEVAAVRDRYSRVKEGGPWKEEFPEMGKKTVLRRLCKMLPTSPELAAAVALDEMHESGIPQELGEAMAPDLSPAEEPSGEPKGKLDKLADTMRGGGELPLTEPAAKT